MSKLKVNKIELRKKWGDTYFHIKYAEEDDLELWRDAHEILRGEKTREESEMEAIAELIKENKLVILTWRKKRSRDLLITIYLDEEKEKITPYPIEYKNSELSELKSRLAWELYRRNNLALQLFIMYTTKKNCWESENLGADQTEEIQEKFEDLVEVRGNKITKIKGADDSKLENRCRNVLGGMGWDRVIDI